MFPSSFCACCVGDLMGSMCAKQTSNDSPYLERPKRHNSKDEEVQPLVDELPNHKKLDELIPPVQIAQSQNKEASPSLSVSSFVSEDKQLLDEVLNDAQQLNSDDNIEVPEYSKNENNAHAQTPIDVSVPNNNSDLNDVSVYESKQEEHKDKDITYALPSTITETPLESKVKMNAEDEEFAKEISKQYASQLSKHQVDKMYFLERYTVGYQHIKKKKRMKAICKDVDYFFEMHEKYDIDHIVESASSSQELNAWKQFIYGEDAAGHPIMYDLIGSSDCALLKEVFMKEDEAFGDRAFKHMFRFMRKMENYKAQNTQKYGVKIYKQIQILDMKEFTADHLKGKNRKIVKLMIDALTRMYPEGTYKMFIINAPWPFRAIWKMIKGFMDPITVSKTKVIGEDFLKEMIKDIPLEMIPQKYGGRGVWKIQYGTVPKHYPVDVNHGLD